VNQFNHAGTLGLDGLACFRERDGIAAVQKQSDIGAASFSAIAVQCHGSRQ